MLNLSDKELDRFSKEAAQEYEPGDMLGERAWERLEVRLDRDLGRVNPNPLKHIHIRRFPFYYAPAMLVLLGVSYYLVKRSGNHPPGAGKAPAVVVQNSSSTQAPINTEKSTPLSSAATTTTSADQVAGSAVGDSKGGPAAGAGAGTSGAAGTGAVAHVGSAAGAGANASAGTGTPAGSGAAAGSTGAAAGAGLAAGTTGLTREGDAVNGAAGITHTNRNHRGRGNNKNNKGYQDDNALAIAAPANAGRAAAGRNASMVSGAASDGNAGTSNGAAAGASTRGSSANGVTAGSNSGSGQAGQAAAAKELTRTTLQGLRPTKKAAFISDSALRAFTLKSTAPQPIRNHGLHINRSLELGVLAAPDFANVNSLAGDRPGSTIGVTADYQFANHWYIGSGLLLDRKIFAADSQDFKAPPQFYQEHGMSPKQVYLVKGTFEMLEIPLNLRYDFSVTSSTQFFIGAGVSSYVLTSENNNYYFHPMFSFRDVCKPISSPESSYLFSTLKLTAGVEAGLSNSLSLLIAPYVNLPLRGVGVGQVQMSTVGINFSLRFAPVISRKRY
jgi:hypothetical protein